MLEQALTGSRHKVIIIKALKVMEQPGRTRRAPSPPALGPGPRARLRTVSLFTLKVIGSGIHSLIHSFTLSFTHSLIHSFIQSFILSLTHSFIHSFTHSPALPMSSCQRLGTEPCTGHMPPGCFRGRGPALLLIVPWQDLSLLVSESRVRAIPSDKISPRLKLPVSSYLHQPISTCLSILMAYGSRGEISK